MRENGSGRKLSIESALEMVRSYHVRGETQASLAKRFGVAPATVHAVVHGRIYASAYQQVRDEVSATENGGA